MQFRASTGTAGVTIGSTTYTPDANGIITVPDSQVSNALVIDFTSLGILPFFAATDPSTVGTLQAGAASEVTLSAVAGRIATLVGHEQPYQGVVPFVVGTPQTAQRAVRINCTAAGNVSMTYADGSIDVVPVNVGLSFIPSAITTINASGTTATATYANVK